MKYSRKETKKKNRARATREFMKTSGRYKRRIREELADERAREKFGPLKKRASVVVKNLDGEILEVRESGRVRRKPKGDVDV